uniref:Uncharacterized protein n=1 Tax=Romanomermis culicivorax TaxID=13658 RepID=A0A915IH33_ROMCU
MPQLIHDPQRVTIASRGRARPINFKEQKVNCPNTWNMKSVLIIVAILMLAVMDPIIKSNSPCLMICAAQGNAKQKTAELAIATVPE